MESHRFEGTVDVFPFLERTIRFYIFVVINDLPRQAHYHRVTTADRSHVHAACVGTHPRAGTNRVSLSARHL